MSTRPHASRVLATRFSSWALSEMRAVTAIASPPLATIAAAASSQGAALRAEITTRPPASANASAIARPMPRLEPVTIVTFPDRSNSFMRFLPPRISRQEIPHAGEQYYQEDDHVFDQSGETEPRPIMLGEDRIHRRRCHTILVRRRSAVLVQPNRGARQVGRAAGPTGSAPRVPALPSRRSRPCRRRSG